MSYGGELSGRRRYSALVWTAQEQLRPSAPPEPEPPARFPVVWAGLWRDRPGQFPISRLGQDSEGYRVLSPSPSGQLNMAKEATSRAEIGFVTNGLHQESGGTNGTSAGARRELEDAEPVVRKTLDPNRYATKKTIAQGMLDVALLTANASQLRYVLQVGEEHEFYTLMVTLISLSIILQILVGVLLMVLGALDINDESPTQMAADIINDVTVIMVFIITLLNVIIASFGIEATQRLFVTASPAPEAV